MPKWMRAYVIACCALIGGAFAYAACDWGQWPRLTYLPIRGEMTMHAPAGSVAMTYIGNVAWGIGGAACGAIVGAMLCRVAPRAWSAKWLQLFGAWAITAILLAGAYFTWITWPW